MREFLQAVCDYPWTTFFIFVGITSILNAANGKR